MTAHRLHGATPRLLVALVLPATLLTGCASNTKELDTHAIETQIIQGVATAYSVTIQVTCPTHVPIHPGDTFACTVHGMGTVREIDVRIKDSAGHVQWALPGHG